jgi:hypothetical protein
MSQKSVKRGQSIVEFTLIIPIVIFAITVFIDLGRVVYSYSALSHAVREGTRFAIVNPPGTVDEQNAIIEVIKDNAVGLDETNITVTFPVLPVDPDFLVTIHASYTIAPVTPGLSLILGTGNVIHLQAESSMQVAPLYQ